MPDIDIKSNRSLLDDLTDAVYDADHAALEAARKIDVLRYKTETLLRVYSDYIEGLEFGNNTVNMFAAITIIVKHGLMQEYTKTVAELRELDLE